MDESCLTEIDSNLSRLTLTVFFEEPFWAGLFERIDDGKLSVCKVTFGAEPKDCEMWEFVLKNYGKQKFSPHVEVTVKKESANPKRAQREARKRIAQVGVGTKSQQALKLQREENKLAKKSVCKQRREEEKQRRFDLKQQKRKKKHKGR